MKKTTLLVIGSAVISATAGAAGGYIFAKRQLEAGLQETLAEEIEITKQFYARMNKKDYPTPAEAVKDLLPPEDAERLGSIVRTYQGSATEQEAAEVVANIFDKDPPLDPGPEEADKNYPTLIPEDTYMTGDSGATQVTLTYYTGDQILADERDEVIEVPNQMVGNSNLQVFHDSPDTTTIYVRNRRLEIDYEIVRSEGSYGVEVAGLV